MRNKQIIVQMPCFHLSLFPEILSVLSKIHQ